MRALAITDRDGAHDALDQLGVVAGHAAVARMSAGTRSSAMTATAPASSAILAWSAVTTSMMTPPLSISASPLTRRAGVVSRDREGADSVMGSV